MNSTRKQRRAFLQEVKKSNPRITKTELQEIKNQMRNLGKEKTDKLEKEKNELLAEFEPKEFNLDSND